MGVAYFPCDYCNESICDCGDYVRCSEDCGRRWCDEKCAELDGFTENKDEEDDYGEYRKSCFFCRNEEVEDEELLDYMFKKYCTNREEMLEEYLEWSKK